jgi:predicted nuclease of restriction endonuclease-like (RecB) superfamily
MKTEKVENKNDFEQIVKLINETRDRTFRQINAEIVKLYYEIGRTVSERVTDRKWGEKTVDELAAFIKLKTPELKGFTRRGLYRMKQFYETYSPESECFKLWNETRNNKLPEIVSPVVTQLKSLENQPDNFVSILLTQISWSNHLEILSGAKRPEEKIFYLLLSIKDRLSKRELERQISSAVFERYILGNKIVSAVRTQNTERLLNQFKDPYIFEFLDLPDNHSESDLQKSLVANFRKFILEIGKGFTYMGEGYRLQVGNEDFYLDLLFYHRELQCLVNFELKIQKFKPEFLGKLNFYLEALDRDVKKDHENPSIGVLLCKGKDDTVVEYALARNLSPAVIADYETKLPDKNLLRAKLEEFSDLIESISDKYE